MSITKIVTICTLCYLNKNELGIAEPTIEMSLKDKTIAFKCLKCGAIREDTFDTEGELIIDWRI